MLHEAGQRHLVRRGELGDRQIPAGERIEDAAPRRVGERGENRIEIGVRILNHKV